MENLMDNGSSRFMCLYNICIYRGFKEFTSWVLIGKEKWKRKWKLLLLSLGFRASMKRARNKEGSFRAFPPANHHVGCRVEKFGVQGLGLMVPVN